MPHNHAARPAVTGVRAAQFSVFTNAEGMELSETAAEDTEGTEQGGA
jgi:hypothetical protein